jgi:hypothetical protein
MATRREVSEMVAPQLGPVFLSGAFDDFLSGAFDDRVLNVVSAFCVGCAPLSVGAAVPM